MDHFDFTNPEPIFDLADTSAGDGDGGIGAPTSDSPSAPPSYTAFPSSLPQYHSADWQSAHGLSDMDAHYLSHLAQERHQAHPFMASTMGTHSSAEAQRQAQYPTAQQQARQRAQQQAQLHAQHQAQHQAQQQAQQHAQQQQQDHQTHAQHSTSRPGSNHSDRGITLPSSGLDFDCGNVLGTAWQYQIPPHMRPVQQTEQQTQQRPFHFPPLNTNPFNRGGFAAPLHSAPVSYMPTTTGEGGVGAASMGATHFMPMSGPMESMQSLGYPLTDYIRDLSFPTPLTTHELAQHGVLGQAAVAAEGSLSSSGGSPTGTALEVASISDNDWSVVNVNSNRSSLQAFATVSNPSQNLHIRTHSDSSSDDPSSAELSSSWEEVAEPWPIQSPHDLHGTEYLDAQYIRQQTQGVIPQGQRQTSPTSPQSMSPPEQVARSYRSSSDSTGSPPFFGPVSPPSGRRRKTEKSPKSSAVKKSQAQTSRKDLVTQKKIGRRKGPLRPDQRQSAHEIRKMRACMRCRFLKKTCDPGEPCNGCCPAHARLWQVPCTRLDIKDMAYFMKDWIADYERHVSPGFTVSNIKNFGESERVLYISHGFGQFMPISARHVDVHDDKCFSMDWVESIHVTPRAFEVKTAKLSAGKDGISTEVLSQYLDAHLDHNFEEFVNSLFEGTFFLTEILITAYNYYKKEGTESIRKALKFVLAYNLTMHLTLVEGLTEAEQAPSKVPSGSRFSGKVIAPVMINFQVKCALATMWRELQQDVINELAKLYHGVYNGNKLQHWPTIFMLAAILLAVWEEMQFDCHYRILDEAKVNKFCDDMESVPVGVIAGLFQAISTKLPGFQEWDSRKHHYLLNSNPAVCDAMTEVKGHVDKYETYLRDRSNAKFDRNDFDSLSNKFLSKLVIRAN